MRETRVRRGEASGVGILIFVILVIAALGAWRITSANRGHHADTGPWLPSIDAGMHSAAERGRPMLVLFTADWCPACCALERDVLDRDEVMEQLNAGWVLVKIDLTEPGGPGGAVARQQEVMSIPTIMAFDADGYQLETYRGGHSAADLLQWSRRLSG